MQNTGKTKHFCRICGKRLPDDDLRDNTWVCHECNRKQLEERGLSNVNEDKRRWKEEKRWEEQQQLKKQGYLTIDGVADKSSVSRRTVWNRIKRYRKLVDAINSGHRVRVNYRKYLKLNKEIKQSSDWAYQENGALRRSMKKVAEFSGYTHVVSLEEAVRVTGFSRRYLRRLISKSRIQAIENLKFPEYNEPRYWRRHKRPIVFINLPSVVRLTGRIFKPKKSYDFPSLPIRPAVSQIDINRLTRLLPLLPGELRKKVNTFPEEYRLPIAREYFALQYPDKWLTMKDELLSIT